jgi:hypothetical protein
MQHALAASTGKARSGRKAGYQRHLPPRGKLFLEVGGDHLGALNKLLSAKP